MNKQTDNELKTMMNLLLTLFTIAILIRGYAIYKLTKEGIEYDNKEDEQTHQTAEIDNDKPTSNIEDVGNATSLY